MSQTQKMTFEQQLKELGEIHSRYMNSDKPKMAEIRHAFYFDTKHFENFNKGKIKVDLIVTPIGELLFVKFSLNDTKAIIEQFNQYCFKI